MSMIYFLNGWDFGRFFAPELSLENKNRSNWQNHYGSGASDTIHVDWLISMSNTSGGRQFWGNSNILVNCSEWACIWHLGAVQQKARRLCLAVLQASGHWGPRPPRLSQDNQGTKSKLLDWFYFLFNIIRIHFKIYFTMVRAGLWIQIQEGKIWGENLFSSFQLQKTLHKRI